MSKLYVGLDGSVMALDNWEMASVSRRNTTPARLPSSSSNLVVAALLLIGCAAVCASSRALAADTAKRARPPKFANSIRDAFFPDARKELVGPRPERTTGAPALDAAPKEASGAEAAKPGARQWSKLIAAETIEDEIKAQQRKLAESVQSATKFKGGDYKRARVHLGVLATLFAIDAQYDQPMRWQREAPAVRDVMARAGFNCKVGTDASHREARQVADDLEGLVRGGTIQVPKGGAETGWAHLVERSVLMKRLEQAQEQSLAPWTANASEFERQGEAIWNEAQVMAAVAEVIQADGYEFADDDTYREYARDMQAQALAVRDAAAQGDHERARRAVGEAGKACASCHEGYRN